MRRALILLGAGLALACEPAPPGSTPSSRAQPITRGTSHAGDPAVGLLIIEDATGAALLGRCTATLVGERTVLTAAHCFVKDARHLLLLEGHKLALSATVPYPDYDATGEQIPPEHDIGVGRLAAAPGIAPAIVAVTAPPVGASLSLVGYGATAADAMDAGEKRRATTVVEQLAATRFAIPADGGGNLCKGDSGGPAFATLAGQQLQVGVASAAEGVCGESRAWETRVDAYVDWLERVAGGDLRRADREAAASLAPADPAIVPPRLRVAPEVGSAPACPRDADCLPPPSTSAARDALRGGCALARGALDPLPVALLLGFRRRGPRRRPRA